MGLFIFFSFFLTYHLLVVMSGTVQNLMSMFPSLSEDTITAVLEAQGGDADKACDELLNMAVGDDLFNRSIYIEDNLSASQNLQRFDKQQEDIWRKCKEREEKRLAEQRRKEEDELRRKQKQEQILAERRAKQEAAKREEEARLKEEAKRKEEQRILAERKAKQEELKKQERETEVLKQERIKLEIQAEKDALAAQKAELEARAKTEADELAKIASEKAALEEKLAQQSPPKISIYTRKQQSEKDHNQDEITEEIKEKFILNGFSDNEIKVIDVSCDMELASFLKNICGDLENLKFPIVCTGNMPIGTIEQVNTLIESESQLQQLKDGKFTPDFLTTDQTNSLKDGTGVFVGQGVLDHCLDAAEYVVSGVSTLLWLPVSIVTYPFRSEKPGLEKGADDVDFDIVHTNWYWRNLKRRFRFTKNGILRIHPTHNDIRASHPYSSILAIKILSETTIVINYNDASSPDYVCATSTAINTMIELIQKRSEKEPVIIRESDLN